MRIPISNDDGYQSEGLRVLAGTLARCGEIIDRESFGASTNSGPGTDFHALRNGYVSVSPLQVDLTRHAPSIRWRAGWPSATDGG